jgi:hypothetical protein
VCRFGRIPKMAHSFLIESLNAYSPHRHRLSRVSIPAALRRAGAYACASRNQDVLAAAMTHHQAIALGKRSNRTAGGDYPEVHGEFASSDLAGADQFARIREMKK